MQRFTTTSADRSTALAAYRWIPEHPRAMLQLSHGMCEYILRYREFAEFLAQEGILVFGHDHLGHGYTAPSTQELGYIARENGADLLVEDVHNLALKMKQEYPDLPLVLLGHSMGSFVARGVLERYSSTYTAAIICGTAGPGQPTGLGKALTRQLMALFGDHHRSRMMHSIAFGGYNKKCGPGCDRNAWLTRDEAVVTAYNSDPLCNYNFTLRGYYDLFTLLERVNRAAWAETLGKDLPVLVVSGEEDPVGNWGVGPRKVAEALLEAGMSDVTLRLYPGMRHEIINEIDRENVWRELLEWLNQKFT